MLFLLKLESSTNFQIDIFINDGDFELVLFAETFGIY